MHRNPTFWQLYKNFWATCWLNPVFYLALVVISFPFIESQNVPWWAAIYYPFQLLLMSLTVSVYNVPRTT